MHVVATMKNWSHHLHDSLVHTGHHMSAHLHNRSFWAGVVITLLLISAIIMLFMLARSAPYIYPLEKPPFVPYM